jgi:hypothetical protein
MPVIKINPKMFFYSRETFILNYAGSGKNRFAEEHGRYHSLKERVAVMKRNLGGLFAGILLVLAFFQSAPALELSAGARLGMNVSGILGDTTKIMMPRFGFCFTAFASEWLNESFGLQEDLVVGFKGESLKNPDVIDDALWIRYPIHFVYLEVPILAKWKFLKRERFRPVLYGGPNIAFPVISDAVSYGGNTTDLMSKTQPVDVGLTAGFALEVKQGNAVIPVDIRYTIGFIDFLKRDEMDPYSIRLTHSVLSISIGLGWIFDLEKKKEF